MSMIKKLNILVIIFLIFMYVGTFLFIKNINKYNVVSFYICLGLSLILFIILIKLIEFFLIKKYLNVLDEELDPEKFIKLTDIEFNDVKKKKSKRYLIYKNFLKLNYSVGYVCIGEKEKALEKLNEIDIENKKKPLFKLLYYYNKSLLLLDLKKRDETIKAYEKLLEIRTKNKKIEKKLKKEIIIYIDILKYEIYDKNNTEKLSELYEKLLSTGKNKRFIIDTKFILAELKERQGEIDLAKQFYKEVVENGNKLYIVENAKKKLLEL